MAQYRGRGSDISTYEYTTLDSSDYYIDVVIPSKINNLYEELDFPSI